MLNLIGNSFEADPPTFNNGNPGLGSNYVVYWGGVINLIGNSFSGPLNHPALIADAVYNSANGGIFSSGNYYNHGDTTLNSCSGAFRDGSGNCITPEVQYNGQPFTKVTSIGDSGGAPGSPTNLVNVLSATQFNLGYGQLLGIETTAPSSMFAGDDSLWPDSTAHRWKMNNNNGSNDTVVGAATMDTLTNKTLSSAVIGPATTVAGLPTCNGSTQDQIRVVMDANAPTYNATVVGGGAVRIPVYCNGNNWTAH